MEDNFLNVQFWCVD